MSANSNQKLKLLYVYKMLNEETDAEHGLSMTQILERLAQVGISAERKGIYRDIDVLRSFGFTITTIQHVPVEYTLEHKGMSTAELVLLADAVQSSVFVDEQTSNKLVESICNLAPVHEQEQLKKQVFVNKRIQSQSESVFYKVDAIQEAMRSGCKVAFTYFKYDNAMQRRFLNGGEPFVLTPVRVVLSDGCYYLVTWSDKHECFVRFRVDRMDAVSVSQEPVTQNDAIAGYTLQDLDRKSVV